MNPFFYNFYNKSLGSGLYNKPNPIPPSPPGISFLVNGSDFILVNNSSDGLVGED